MGNTGDVAADTLDQTVPSVTSKLLKAVPSAETSQQQDRLTLSGLCAELHKELDHKGIHEMESMDVAKIKALMERYVSNEEDWARFAHFDQNRYTRNLVDAGNSKFNLMVLCWSEEQQSPIHDHAGAHCLMKVLSGNIVESQFEWPESATPAKMVTRCDNTYVRNQVAYIHDKLGLHRIANRSPDTKAVSLHLYCPPYETCQTFNERTSESRGSGKCVFYTINGERQIPSCLS